MSERRDKLHPAKAGAITMALSIVALAGTGVAVVRTAVSNGDARGLQYGALTSELNLALRSAPADDLLRVDTSLVQIAGSWELLEGMRDVSIIDTEEKLDDAGGKDDAALTFRVHAIDDDGNETHKIEFTAPDFAAVETGRKPSS